MKKIPFRQIHLDFHTSSYIDGIAEQFDSKEFISILKDAHVNSINLFTKCHHGMFYYPTKIGTVHPNLKIDLFGEQIKACKENGIRALAYTCVAWNEDWADRHPEWLIVDYNGLSGGKKPFDCNFYQWRNLCINNPDYKRLLKDEMKEVYDLYHPDGYWIDIVLGKDCICAHCSSDMKKAGLDPQNYNDIKRFNKMVEIKFCEEFYRYLKTINPDMEIYFNSHPYELDDAQDVACSSVTKRPNFDFIDIESLPSEQWGYTHFPIAANYINKYEQDICMMNGKFHTAWGDFGSLRHIYALEYECFRAIANGARICIGDQLHPSGKLDKTVYNRISQVFSQVEKMEYYVEDVKKIRDVCVLIPTQAAIGDPSLGGIIEEGVYRVLSELHIPFDFVNSTDLFDLYRLMILPDEVKVSNETAKRIDDFVKNGGKLIVTGVSGMKDGKFAVKSICAEYISHSNYDTRYIHFDEQNFSDIPRMDHVLYYPGEQVKANGEILATIVNPYFSRTYEHFCSHRQTPPKIASQGEPAIIKDENCIYIAAPLFKSYADFGYTIYRDIIKDSISMLYDEPYIKTNLPALTELTLWEHKDGIVTHMLNYVIQKKAKKLDTIETVFTVVNKSLSIKTGFKPTAVLKLPDKTSIDFAFSNGYVTIPIACEQGYTSYLIQN